MITREQLFGRSKVSRVLDFGEHTSGTTMKKQKVPDSRSAPVKGSKSSPGKGTAKASNKSGSSRSSPSKGSKHHAPGKSVPAVIPKGKGSEPPVDVNSKERRSDRIPAQRKKEMFNLAKMNSTEFDALIGESSTPEAKLANEETISQQKQGTVVFQNSLASLGSTVVTTPSIFDGISVSNVDGVNQDGSIRDSNVGTLNQNDNSTSIASTALLQEGNKSDALSHPSPQRGASSSQITTVPANKSPVKSPVKSLEKTSEKSPEKSTPTKSPTHTRPDYSPRITPTSSINKSPFRGSDVVLNSSLSGSTTAESPPRTVCENCLGLLTDLNTLIQRLTPGKQGGILNQQIASNFEREQMVPLFKGSKTLVPLTKRKNLKFKINTKCPQDLVEGVMDMLYKPEEMQRMSANGRTPNSIAMDDDVKDDIMTFVSVKYDAKNFEFDKSILNKIINYKCYKVRRLLWKKKRDGKNVNVRSPLKKRVSRQSKSAPKKSTAEQRRTAEQKKKQNQLSTSKPPKPKHSQPNTTVHRNEKSSGKKFKRQPNGVTRRRSEQIEYSGHVAAKNKRKLTPEHPQFGTKRPRPELVKQAKLRQEVETKKTKKNKNPPTRSQDLQSVASSDDDNVDSSYTRLLEYDEYSDGNLTDTPMENGNGDSGNESSVDDYDEEEDDDEEEEEEDEEVQ